MIRSSSSTLVVFAVCIQFFIHHFASNDGVQRGAAHAQQTCRNIASLSLPSELQVGNITAATAAAGLATYMVTQNNIIVAWQVRRWCFEDEAGIAVNPKSADPSLSLPKKCDFSIDPVWILGPSGTADVSFTLADTGSEKLRTTTMLGSPLSLSTSINIDTTTRSSELDELLPPLMIADEEMRRVYYLESPGDSAELRLIADISNPTDAANNVGRMPMSGIFGEENLKAFIAAERRCAVWLLDAAGEGSKTLVVGPIEECASSPSEIEGSATPIESGHLGKVFALQTNDMGTVLFIATEEKVMKLVFAPATGMPTSLSLAFNSRLSTSSPFVDIINSMSMLFTSSAASTEDYGLVLSSTEVSTNNCEFYRRRADFPTLAEVVSFVPSVGICGPGRNSVSVGQYGTILVATGSSLSIVDCSFSAASPLLPVGSTDLVSTPLPTSTATESPARTQTPIPLQSIPGNAPTSPPAAEDDGSSGTIIAIGIFIACTLIAGIIIFIVGFRMYRAREKKRDEERKRRDEEDRQRQAMYAAQVQNSLMLAGGSMMTDGGSYHQQQQQQLQHVGSVVSEMNGLPAGSLTNSNATMMVQPQPVAHGYNEQPTPPSQHVQEYLHQQQQHQLGYTPHPSATNKHLVLSPQQGIINPVARSPHGSGTNNQMYVPGRRGSLGGSAASPVLPRGGGNSTTGSEMQTGQGPVASNNNLRARLAGQASSLAEPPQQQYQRNKSPVVDVEMMKLNGSGRYETPKHAPQGGSVTSGFAPQGLPAGRSGTTPAGSTTSNPGGRPGGVNPIVMGLRGDLSHSMGGAEVSAEPSFERVPSGSPHSTPLAVVRQVSSGGGGTVNDRLVFLQEQGGTPGGGGITALTPLATGSDHFGFGANSESSASQSWSQQRQPPSPSGGGGGLPNQTGGARSANTSIVFVDKDENEVASLAGTRNSVITNQTKQYPQQFMVVQERRALIQQGKYSRMRLVGRGAAGSVFSCLLENGATVAQKEILLDPPEEDDMTQTQALQKEFELVEAEVDILVKVQHPNIVQYYACERHLSDKKMFLFMEYVGGGSLGSTIRGMSSPLSEAAGRKYVLQLVLALCNIHRQGIVHRDLKCDNILLTLDGVIKLADFGTAKRVGTGTVANNAAQSLVGTPYFIAPEVLLADANAGYGPKADIWSLGITVGEMLNKGEMPWPMFANPGQAFIYIGQETSVPEFAEKVMSPEAIDFCRSCCQREPEKRPNAFDLLSHKWLEPEIGHVEDKAELINSEIPEELLRMGSNGEGGGDGKFYSPRDGSFGGNFASGTVSKEAQEQQEMGNLSFAALMPVHSGAFDPDGSGGAGLDDDDPENAFSAANRNTLTVNVDPMMGHT